MRFKEISRGNKHGVFSITFNNSQITSAVNAIQEATTQLDDWLPFFVSILVIVIGVFLTYDRNIAIEEKKRQYELKKQTYLSFWISS